MSKGVLDSVRDHASEAGQQIGGWFKGVHDQMSPEARAAIMRGVAGATVGGGLTGTIAAMTPHDPAERHPVAGPTLLGALMGGGAAAGLPAGLKMMGGVRFDHEKGRPAGAKLTDSAIKHTLVRHPAATALTAYTAFSQGGRNAAIWPKFLEALRRAKPGFRTNAHGKVLSRPGKAWDALKMTAKLDKSAPGPGRLAFLPVALGGGMILDKYLRGDY